MDRSNGYLRGLRLPRPPRIQADTTMAAEARTWEREYTQIGFRLRYDCSVLRRDSAIPCN